MSNIAALNIETKKCKVCCEVFNISMFSINRASKDGLQVVCRYCDKKRVKENRNKRIDDVRRKAREYRAKKTGNFEFRIKSLFDSSKQRAASKGREHTITIEDVIDAFPPDGKCPIFGFKLEWNSAGFRETSPSIDRIDSSKGYTIDNIQIISWKANRIKSYATIEEIEAVLNYLKSGG